jgi:hypothetical protein
MKQVTYRTAQSWIDPRDEITIATLHMHCPLCHEAVMFAIPVDDPIAKNNDLKNYKERMAYLLEENHRLKKVIDILQAPTRFYDLVKR